MNAPDHELGIKEHFTIGQIKLTNEELLFEDLNVPVDVGKRRRLTLRCSRDLFAFYEPCYIVIFHM